MRDGSQSKRRATLRTTPRAFALACFAFALIACQSLSDLDRKVERALAEASTELDGGTIPPATRRDPPPSPEYTRPQIATNPPSTNPPPEAIRFDASPEMSIEERLDRLESYFAGAEEGEEFTLADALRAAQKTGREYLDAEEDYILASIRLLIERHLWGPRFFNDTTLAIDANPALAGGNYTSALSVINDLRATQRLPYGGEVEARAIVRATEQLREVVGTSYTQSAEIVLAGNIPLLRGAGLVAREDLIQAERDLVYAARSFEDFRRTFLVQIARDYFDLYRQQEGIRNQRSRLDSVTLGYEQTAAQVDAGRRPAFEARNFEQNVLNSQNSLVNAQESYVLAIDRFKIRLGIPTPTRITLTPVDLSLPEPATTPEQAVAVALQNRLDLQNTRDRVEDSKRSVANARNGLLPDLNLAGSVNFNTPQDEDVGALDFRLNQTDYRASATLSLPLDREIERLNLRSAIIALNRQVRGLSRTEDEIILQVRQAVREIDRSRFSLELQEQTVAINELRLEELILKQDSTTVRERLDAENELLQSRDNRDSAIRDLRVAILGYLLATGQLRVAPDGRLQPLAGMAATGSGAAEPLGPIAEPDAPAPNGEPAPEPEPDAIDAPVDPEPAPEPQ